MADTGMKWYVLRAVSGKEAKVKEYIEAEIKNGRLGGNVSQVLVATEKTLQKRADGKSVVKDRNTLPGYVLVEACLTGETAHDLRVTPNVLGFLGGLDNPTPVRQSDINRILGRVDEMPEMDVNVVFPFEVGEKVKVNDGPFSGFSGEIEEINHEKKTLTVSVKVFGRSTPLNLGFSQVEKE